MSDPTVLIRVGLPDATWVEAQEILSAQRWREEEGLGILAGYGFGVHVESYAEDVLYAFGAARGELSSLRHRTFMADDAVRNLKMNLTGLRASVQQARRSLERLQEEVAALRMRAQLVGVDPATSSRHSQVLRIDCSRSSNALERKTGGMSRITPRPTAEGQIPQDDLIFLEVRDALAHTGCPICRLACQASQRHLGGFLYEYVNDPGTRQELLASRGFCQHHAWALTPFRDALGVAIVYRHLLQDLIGELQRNVERLGARSGRRRRGPGAGLPAMLGQKMKCPVCRTVSRVEEASLHGLLSRLDDPQVSEQLGGDAALCLPHLLAAVEMSHDPAIAGRLMQMHIASCQKLARHLDELIRKYDYRFRNEDISAMEAESWTRALELLVGQDPLEIRKIKSTLG